MMNFEQFISEYKEERKDAESSQATIERYVRHVRNWREWLTENRDKTLWEADNIDLRIFIRELDRDGLASSTINQKVSGISTFYQDAATIVEEKKEEGRDVPDVPENPYDNLRDKYKSMLNGDTKKKQAMSDSSTDEYPYLEPEKVAELVENVPAPRLRNELIIKLLFNIGFRRGELANAKEGHINREDRSVYIPPRKSPESRTVAYNEGYLGFQLDRWLDHGGRDSMTYATDSDYLFPTNKSEHISASQINEIVKDTARNAGIQEQIAEYADGRKIHRVTAHTLRHSFAMQMLNSGVDIRKLQTLLGHDELDTTLIYLQQSKEEAKEQSRMFQPEA